jgi:hypothetical protein
VTDRPDEITIREAAELAGVKPKGSFHAPQE